MLGLRCVHFIHSFSSPHAVLLLFPLVHSDLKRFHVAMGVRYGCLQFQSHLPTSRPRCYL